MSTKDSHHSLTKITHFAVDKFSPHLLYVLSFQAHHHQQALHDPSIAEERVGLLGEDPVSRSGQQKLGSVY